MKISISVLAVIALMSFAAVGCKKSDSTQEEKDKFSFIYNGRTYEYSLNSNHANAYVSKGIDGTPCLVIDMFDVFGGQIHFEKTGCAYFIPSDANYRIDINEDHKLTAIKTDGSGIIIPIDSVKVFLYQSGSLNVPFSNCVGKSGVDYITGLAYSYTDCAALGTFDLTLINKNNETIKITNGVVKVHHINL